MDIDECLKNLTIADQIGTPRAIRSGRIAIDSYMRAAGPDPEARMEALGVLATTWAMSHGRDGVWVHDHIRTLQSAERSPSRRHMKRARDPGR